MIEDTRDYENETETCVVCGKDITGRDVFARLDHSGTTVSLCCPHCLETFQNDPVPHMKRYKKVLAFRSLRSFVQPHR